jgi:hypothetical protein
LLSIAATEDVVVSCQTTKKPTYLKLVEGTEKAEIGVRHF